MANPPKALSNWGLFPGPNIQVTSDNARADKTSGSRSECDLAIDPSNANIMIAASKRFIDNFRYTFTTATAYTDNGGDTWYDSNDLWLDASQGWIGYTDPTVAFDDKSNGFLVSEPIIDTGVDIDGRGMFCFRTANGGASWQTPPAQWDNDPKSDKQWVATDVSDASPFKGNVYACWGANTPLRFSRSSDSGNTWRGVGNQPAAAALTTQGVYAPAICVTRDGTIHIAWHAPGTPGILHMESSDGGNTFSKTGVAADSITSISSKFQPPPGGDFPVFPHGSFRVMTLVAIAPYGERGCVIAWADARGPYSRIYYRVRDDDGNWAGPADGRALLADINLADGVAVQHFHPQLAVNSSGIVGCAFYEFGQKKPDNDYRIDVKVASSSLIFSGTYPVTFFYLASVTETAWNPLIDPPHSHGNAVVTFIGEYFGFDSVDDDFCVLWTDTRTGKQELWFSRVKTFRPPRPKIRTRTPEIVGIISPGVAAGGGGWIYINGVRYPVPPRGPVREIVELLVAHELVARNKSKSRQTLAKKLMTAISDIAAGKIRSTPRNRG